MFFFISIAQWSVEEDDTIMRKVAKGEGKTRDKNGKTANVLRSKTTNRHTAFKITFRRDIKCFCIKAGTCIKKRTPRFLTLCMANFGLTANSLFKIWKPARSSARTSRFHKNFFPSLDRTVLFLSSYGPFFFFILPRTFFRF